MSNGVLLDTCAIIWIAEDAAIDTQGRAAITSAEEQNAVHVSPISGWEIATLVGKNRLALSIPVERWFGRFLDARGTVLADLPVRVLIGSVFLPGSPPNDPADRILAATARELDLTLVTRDKAILSYAAEGHVRAVAC